MTPCLITCRAWPSCLIIVAWSSQALQILLATPWAVLAILNERAPPEPARRSAVDRNSDGAPLTGLSEKAKMLVREVTGIPLQDAAFKTRSWTKIGPFDIKCSAHAPLHTVTHTPSQHSRNGRDQSVNVMRRGRVPSRFRVHCWRVYFQSVPKACFVFSDSLCLVLGIIHRSRATLMPKIFAATFFPDRFPVYEVQHVCEKLASREEFRL